eukprot:CAMPEP_0198137044 /NCGR_PEP_ID=MMETSP1443-20131203/601_1 /TAXON_ID=186043 /ORGANISM="Entomoneis sp., Strain CCMP2396" /LENGTH=144 /DNA_ID=CAMNT_0043798369 /DNA_START=77 /DNA_END=511 /DNA_ORIENTATION=+
MSRRIRRGNVEQAKPSSVIVQALAAIGQTEAYGCVWRPMSDIIGIVHALFELPRTMKDALTARLINSHIAGDRFTMNCDPIGHKENVSGIFRNPYRNKAGNENYFFLCCAGSNHPRKLKENCMMTYKDSMLRGFLSAALFWAKE